MSSPSPATAPPSRKMRVHLVSDLVSRCGLSQSARDLRQILLSLDLLEGVTDIPIYAGREEERRRLSEKPPGTALPETPLSIVSLNADCLPAAARLLPEGFFSNRYIIGVWFWETEVFPPHHAAGFDYVDEVWVASGHIRQALERISPVPVRKFTHPVHPASPAGPEKLPDFLRHNRFVFLFCFDFRSMAERKNPAGACEAFIRAFPQAEAGGPLLVLKSAGGDPDNVAELTDLRRRYRHRDDIVFMDGWITAGERDALMSRADCYVSLHRAEGLGLTMLESMTLGKPCIATAYSGNMDFSTAGNSWLIPCRMVPVGPGRWPFASDHLWADPDLDIAAQAMREAWENPALRAEKGQQSRHTALNNHSMATAAGEIRQLIDQASGRTPREKPFQARTKAGEASGPAVSSFRTQAYTLLKSAKASGKKSREEIKNLRGWKIDPGLRAALLALADLQKTQMEIQSLILQEIGQIKNNLRGYDQNTFERLLLDQQRTSLAVRDFSETLWKKAGAPLPETPHS